MTVKSTSSKVEPVKSAYLMSALVRYTRLRSELDKYLMDERIENLQDLIGKVKYHSK